MESLSRLYLHYLATIIPLMANEYYRLSGTEKIIYRNCHVYMLINFIILAFFAVLFQNYFWVYIFYAAYFNGNYIEGLPLIIYLTLHSFGLVFICNDAQWSRKIKEFFGPNVLHGLSYNGTAASALSKAGVGMKAAALDHVSKTVQQIDKVGEAALKTVNSDTYKKVTAVKTVSVDANAAVLGGLALGGAAGYILTDSSVLDDNKQFTTNPEAKPMVTLTLEDWNNLQKSMKDTEAKSKTFQAENQSLKERNERLVAQLNAEVTSNLKAVKAQAKTSTNLDASSNLHQESVTKDSSTEKEVKLS